MNHEQILLKMALDGCLTDLIAEGITENHFIDPLNRRIYTAILANFKNGNPIDLATIGTCLPESTRSMPRLLEISERSTTASPEYFIRIAKNASQNHAIATRAAAALRECSASMADYNLLEQLRSIVNGSESNSQFNVKTDARFMLGLIDAIERDYESGGIKGPKTGINLLDDIIGGGLMPGKLITIAARPGAGKTALATNMALHAAKNGYTPLYITLELNSREIAERLLCTQGLINVENMALRKFSETEMDNLTESCKEIIKTPAIINSTTKGSWNQAEIAIKLACAVDNVKVVFIDYIQQFHVAGAKTHREEITEITSRCKQLALDMQICIVIVAQMNRDIEKRGDSSIPMMSDIKESGSIEQDSDVVMMIFEVKDQKEIENGHYLYIVKNRQGKCAIIKLNVDLAKNKINHESEMFDRKSTTNRKHKLKGIDRTWDDD